MKPLYLLLSVLFFSGSISAQKRCTVVSARAYYSLQLPGNIPVDENGRKIKVAAKKNRFIYVVTSCSNIPVISSLKYDNVETRATVEKIMTKHFLVGKNNEGGNLYVNASKGTYIWKISAEEISLPPDEKSSAVVLKLKIGSNTMTRKITGEIFIQSPEMP